jgi:hypothetical protein
MRDIGQVVSEVEIFMDDFLEWQIERGATHDFPGYALHTAKAEDVLKYAAILYPRFIEVEGAVLLADHYTPEGWASWRKNHGVFESANVINHVHVWDEFGHGPGGPGLVGAVGGVLASFWQMAVDRQFPHANVVVWFDGSDEILFRQGPKHLG